MKRIADLKKGEYFTLFNGSPVWVRGEYDRSSKKYSCYRFDDVCHERFYNGSKLVFVDFEF